MALNHLLTMTGKVLSMTDDSMRRMIVFSVPGEIQGQGRPRTQVIKTKDGKAFAHIYDDPRDAANKHLIQSYAHDAMLKAGYSGLANPTSAGIAVDMIAFIRIPKSMPKKNIQKALSGEIRPLRKPDLDNVAKAVLDAMNSVVFRDDKDVTQMTIRRYYGDKPKVSVRVRWEEKEERR